MIGRMQDELPGRSPSGEGLPGKRLEPRRNHDPVSVHLLAVLEAEAEASIDLIHLLHTAAIDIGGDGPAKPVGVVDVAPRCQLAPKLFVPVLFSYS